MARRGGSDVGALGDRHGAVTVSDGLVCDDCLEIEDNNPHDVFEAQSLLPMHPNCRCAFAPVVTDDDIIERVSDPMSVDLTD